MAPSADQDYDDASISFDESMLGDSDDIVIGGGTAQAAAAGKPPLAGGRLPTASGAGKGRPGPGLPPRAQPPQRRVSGDSGFSLSGSLDFSGDLEVEDVGRGDGAPNVGSRGARGASTTSHPLGPSKGGPATQPQRRSFAPQAAGRGQPRTAGRVSGGSSFELSGDLSLSGDLG